MSKHITAEQIGQYRNRSMAAAELLAFDRHIAHCEECRGQIAREEGVRKLVSGLQAAADAPEHLTYEQMADYADGKCSGLDSEIVESHAELCSRCAVELRVLGAFAGAVAAARASESTPLASEARGLGAISFSKEELQIKIPVREKERNKDQ